MSQGRKPQAVARCIDTTSDVTSVSAVWRDKFSLH
ncbi:hypothetical protein PI125_g26086 [Phytophthora idaei]|nr:hypothetical protein PI125_g26086 [Phytophthora idaei]